MRHGEHVRHFKNRALRLAEDGDADGERQCLELARALCDDHDHELLYDQAVGEHERGNWAAAADLYELALSVCKKTAAVDPRVKNNLAALLETWLVTLEERAWWRARSEERAWF